MTTKKDKTEVLEATTVEPVAENQEVIAGQPPTIDMPAQFMNEMKKLTSDGRDGVFRLVGRWDMARAIADAFGAFDIQFWVQVKEEEPYKHLVGKTIEVDGKTWECDKFDGFCKLLGTSKNSVNEKLQMLGRAGDKGYERIEEIGLPTKYQRMARKLEGDQYEKVNKELMKPDATKEDVIDVIMELSKAHEKENAKLEAEKADLTSKLKAQQEDNAANERIISDKNQHIDKLQKQIVKRENMTLDEQIESLYEELAVAEITCLGPLNLMNDTMAAAIANGDKGLEQRAAALLMNIRNHVDDLFRKHQLEHVDLNQELDDSWVTQVGKDDGEQAQLDLK